MFDVRIRRQPATRNFFAAESVVVGEFEVYEGGWVP